MRRSKMALATALAAAMLMGTTPCVFAAPSPATATVMEVKSASEDVKVVKVSDSVVYEGLTKEEKTAVDSFEKGDIELKDLLTALEVDEEVAALFEGKKPVAQCGVTVTYKDGKAEVEMIVEGLDKAKQDKFTLFLLGKDGEKIAVKPEDVTIDFEKKTVKFELTESEELTSTDFIVIITADITEE